MALAVALTLVVHPTDAPVSFAGPCGVDACPGLFDQLRADISNPSLVPGQFQTTLLQQATLADRAAPVDPCRSLQHLRVVSTEVNGLLQGTRIIPAAANILQSDVSSIVAVLAPTDPC